MAVSILIPYRADDERHEVRLVEGANRSEIFAFVRRRWELLLPEAEIVVARPATKAMNRSQARNRAFAAAQGDVLVVADADIVAEKAQIDAAMARLDTGASWVIGYQHYLQLNGADTRVLLGKAPDSALERPKSPRWSTTEGNAGLLVMDRGAWTAVSGYDERFVEWGWEDWAFANALETLVHGQVRVPGFVLHLCHPRSRNRTKRQGAELFGRYHDAHGDPEAMAKLVSEPGHHS